MWKKKNMLTCSVCDNSINYYSSKIYHFSFFFKSLIGQCLYDLYSFIFVHSFILQCDLVKCFTFMSMIDFYVIYFLNTLWGRKKKTLLPPLVKIVMPFHFCYFIYLFFCKSWNSDTIIVVNMLSMLLLISSLLPEILIVFLSFHSNQHKQALFIFSGSSPPPLAFI